MKCKIKNHPKELLSDLCFHGTWADGAQGGRDQDGQTWRVLWGREVGSEVPPGLRALGASPLPS